MAVQLPADLHIHENDAYLDRRGTQHVPNYFLATYRCCRTFPSPFPLPPAPRPFRAPTHTRSHNDPREGNLRAFFNRGIFIRGRDITVTVAAPIRRAARAHKTDFIPALKKAT